MLREFSRVNYKYFQTFARNLEFRETNSVFSFVKVRFSLHRSWHVVSSNILLVLTGTTKKANHNPVLWENGKYWMCDDQRKQNQILTCEKVPCDFGRREAIPQRISQNFCTLTRNSNMDFCNFLMDKLFIGEMEK